MVKGLNTNLKVRDNDWERWSSLQAAKALSMGLSTRSAASLQAGRKVRKCVSPRNVPLRSRHLTMHINIYFSSKVVCNRREGSLV